MAEKVETNMAVQHIIVSIILSVVILVPGIIGNVVMIIAFIRRRELRTIQNLFNLATFVTTLSWYTAYRRTFRLAH